MNRIDNFLVVFTIVVGIPCRTLAQAGSDTANGFLYKPPLGATAAEEKVYFDQGLDRTDAHLGSYKTLGDPGYSTLDEALTTIGASEVALAVPAGAVAISADTTIPANVCLRALRGAIFQVADGVTLTINGPLEAGPYKIFDLTGSGQAAFGPASVLEVYPEWWGAKADGVTDNAVAINKALVAARGVGKVRFLNGVYVIGSKLMLWATMEGQGKNATVIRASGTFTDSMMVDFYTGSGADFIERLNIKGIQWDGNYQPISCLDSSNDGCGNCVHMIEDCWFTRTTARYAVNFHTTGTSFCGGLTGSMLVNCYWSANQEDLRIGGNQGEVVVQNCRFDHTLNDGGMPINLRGSNTKFISNYHYFANLFLYSGIRAIFFCDASVVSIENSTIQTDGSNITHVFFFGGVHVNYEIKNLFLSINQNSQSPNFQALVRTNVNAWAIDRYPYVKIQNLVEQGYAPTWKLIDLWVGSEAGASDVLTADISGVDYFPWPLFQWGSGSAEAFRPTILIRGVHRTKLYNHEFRQSLGNDNPFKMSSYKDQKGHRQWTYRVYTPSGPSPSIGSITLPESDAIYLVTVSAKVAGNLDQMASGSWIVYLSSRVRDTLDTQQIGQSTFSINNDYGVNSLTLSDPDESRVITATVGWTFPSNYDCYFDFKVHRVSNMNWFGD